MIRGYLPDRLRLGEGAYAFGDLNRLHWALDFTGPAEDAVSFPHRVGLPTVQQWLAAVVRNLLIDLLLLRRKVHLVEDIDWAH